jgi:hypothetical protein
MVGANRNLGRDGIGNRKRKQCKDACRCQPIEGKKLQDRNIQYLSKIQTIAYSITNSVALFAFRFELLYVCIPTKKGDTACYVHPVSTAAEAQSTHKRELDRKRSEEYGRSTVTNRRGHFDEKFVAALKGTCRRLDSVNSYA